MLRPTALFLEFKVVMFVFGTGNIPEPQLMAEIGDVRRFTHKEALVAFVVIDAPPHQPGMFDSKTRNVSNRGSLHPRKTLFTIRSVVLQHPNTNDPVYLFMDKKLREGKHYHVSMIVSVAKFLRSYCQG